MDAQCCSFGLRVGCPPTLCLPFIHGGEAVSSQFPWLDLPQVSLYSALDMFHLPALISRCMPPFGTIFCIPLGRFELHVSPSLRSFLRDIASLSSYAPRVFTLISRPNAMAIAESPNNRESAIYSHACKKSSSPSQGNPHG